MSLIIYLPDLITENALGDTERRMENVEDAEIYGAEDEVKWQFLPEWSSYPTFSKH